MGLRSIISKTTQGIQSLRVKAIHEPRERDQFTYMMPAGDPGYRSLHS